MWRLEKGIAFLSQVSVQRLQAMYNREKNAKAKLRLLAAIRRKRGESIDEIAFALEKPRRTIHGWLTRFQQRGINAKDSIKQTGRPTELTIKQRVALIKILERGPPHNPSGLWSTKELRAMISKKFKRTYVKQHVWRLLVALGFSMQRPRRRHYQRPSNDEIAQFKKKLDVKQDITARKDLLWARRMRQPSVSSRS
jgi:transposase